MGRTKSVPVSRSPRPTAGRLTPRGTRERSPSRRADLASAVDGNDRGSSTAMSNQAARPAGSVSTPHLETKPSTIRQRIPDSVWALVAPSPLWCSLQSMTVTCTASVHCFTTRCTGGEPCSRASVTSSDTHCCALEATPSKPHDTSASPMSCRACAEAEGRKARALVRVPSSTFSTLPSRTRHLTYPRSKTCKVPCSDHCRSGGSPSWPQGAFPSGRVGCTT